MQRGPMKPARDAARDATYTSPYTKKAKDLVSAEEVVAIVRAHVQRAHRVTLLRVAVGVVLWTVAVVLLFAATR